ncbi:energy transducer TonB [Ferruginibacter sp.]|uniref:energy transducer TonB n=1 Tax=Ferruginibacter sp. TaxID=1940288 RepID=UPI0019BF634A|nr:energy transducer TonB [Ferruginibacter sp.]MBC7628593.1 energy transducer TonB [Ferruginibacter sp.]
MDINKILRADVLDIIFEGKNKEYGAYDLRKTYNKRITKALLYTGGVIVLVFLASIFANLVGKGKSEQIEVVDTQMAEIKKAEPPPPIPPPPVKPPPPPVVNQIKFTPPKIVKDEEVKPDEKIEEIKEDQVISTKTVESENKVAIVQAPVEDKGSQITEAPKSNDEDKIFTKVENEAAFPGGEAAWRRFLEKNLNASTPIDNGAPEGSYKVIVRFIVSKDGSISDVQAESKYGYGMEDEAVKVIKRGPKWTPALQNGRNVNAYRRQPITFVVQDN